MFICKVCGQEFETKQKLGGHTGSHYRGEAYATKRMTERSAKRKIGRSIHRCSYCDKEFSTGQSLGSHVRMCKQHPDYAQRRLRATENRQKTLTPDFLCKLGQKISEGVQKKVEEGTWHFSFSKTRTHEYRGEKMYGKWELQYAQWLDNKEIEWRRPKERFPYVFQEKTRYYTPDFYLTSTGEYIEIKGYETEKDRAKWENFPLKLKVLKGIDLYELGVINEKQLKGLQ